MKNDNSSDDDDTLVSIHRQALQKLLLQKKKKKNDNDNDDPELSLLQERLTSLRNHRLQLTVDLQQLQFQQQLVPLSQEIKIVRSKSRHVSDFYSPNEAVVPPCSSTNNDNDNNDDNNDNDNDTQQQQQQQQQQPLFLAERMTSLRKRRRIVGSHRIAGISVTKDKDVLGMRLDISVEGVYVAKHFLFFDIICSVNDNNNNNNDNEQLLYYLRLVQHTLPLNGRLPQIIQRHFGTSFLELKEKELTETDMSIVRDLVGEIHDVCYAHAVRKQGVEFLKKHSGDDNRNDYFSVHNLAVPDTYRHVDFEVEWRHNGRRRRRLMVKLEYGDESNAQPTNVQVTQQNDGSSSNNNELFIQKSIKLFRSMPLWNCFNELRLQELGE